MAADPVPPTAPVAGAPSSLILAGGCFWCTEAAFEAVPGVKGAISGYVAGTLDHPTYEDVCSGTTGHTEAIRVTYDPAVVGLDQLLDLFFRVHDPTTLNRQGNDVGSQYRSAIVVANAEQKAAAQAAIARNQPRFSKPIVTEVLDLVTSGPARFHIAEEYHQDYFRRHPDQAYCAAVIPPKLDKVRKFLHETGKSASGAGHAP